MAVTHCLAQRGCATACLARANADIGQFDDARRCIAEAIAAVETTKEKWCEAEVYRIAGEIALMSPEPSEGKAQACFDRALAVSHQQQAKSWELRAAMRMSSEHFGPRSGNLREYLAHLV